MERYACKFCIALYGLKGAEAAKLPNTRAEAEAHVRTVHGYPQRSAQSILEAKRETGRLAAEIIENSGPVLRIRVITPTEHRH